MLNLLRDIIHATILIRYQCQVADQLRDLHIQQIATTSLAGRQRHDLKRKRLKRNTPVAHTASSNDYRGLGTPEQSRYDFPEPFEPSVEIGETPDCRAQVQSPPSRSPVRSPEPDTVLKDPERQIDELAAAGRSKSSPPLTPRDSLILPVAETEPSRSVSPLPLREDLTPDQAALTWQEDEITGHDIDQASGDDGEGINGVGFRPTPAMAYARRQKRKQQVNEWKAREAREARQKRFERRRGDLLETDPVRNMEARRIVRFAEG